MGKGASSQRKVGTLRTSQLENRMRPRVCVRFSREGKRENGIEGKEAPRGSEWSIGG